MLVRPKSRLGRVLRHGRLLNSRPMKGSMPTAQPLDVDYLISLPRLDGSQNPAPRVHESKPRVEVRDSQSANAQQLSAIGPATVLLGDAWPAKGRHLAQMALAGGLVRYVDDDQATAILCAVAARAGDEDPPKRRKSVAEARAKHLAGAEYTGWPRLAEILGADVVDRARELLGMEATPWVDGSALEGLADGAAADPPEDPLNVVSQGKKAPCSFKEVVYYLSQTPMWQGVFRFNVLSRRHVAVRPPFRMRMEQGGLSDGDLGKIRTWFDSQGFKVGADAIKAAIATICESAGRAWNPFAEYLDALAPSSGALATVHLSVLRVPDPFAAVLLTKTLVAAVRRARAAPGIGEAPPNVDHQGVLVLSGAQGVGKGRLVKILAGEWYSSVDISRLRDKDTVLKCQGSVLVELEEMSTSGAQDRDALKRFLSASDDHERAAYAAGAERTARSYAMIATTNDAQLEDPTGHRRMWPIILTPGTLIDHDMALALRDALWSEANALAATDYDHHLTPVEAARCAQDAALLEREDGLEGPVRDACAGRKFVTIQEVYDHITKGTKKDEVMPRRTQREISDSLRRLGCVNCRPMINGLQLRGWEVHSAVSAATVSPEGAAYRASLEVAAGLRAITQN